MLFFFITVLAACQARAPVIHSINPQIGTMGETVTISGAFFGKERDESYITIAGAQPTSMSYLHWQDDKIIFRIPELGDGGLIYVFVNGKKSNGALFASKATLPVQTQDGGAGAGPVIGMMTPQTGAIGALVSIAGTGFGSLRGSGGVFFSWNAEAPLSAPAEARVQEFTEVSETEFGYEFWSEREIRVRVPDGAVSGAMEVRTARGNSPAWSFNLSGRPGSKIYRDKRTYTINYSVNVRIGEAETPNTLYLWIPRPAESAAQRNLELLSCSMEPFIENHRGASLFKLDNLTPHSTVPIRLAWKADVYSTETAVLPQSVRQEFKSPVSDALSQSSPQLPSDDPRIQKQAAAILGRERNPYIKAQKIYEWMLDGNFEWVEQAEGDMFDMMESKQADAYLAALLYCTLLRSAGVPCQPVSGVLVSRTRQTKHHYWAEFWVDDFGWIPVDPAMGAGAIASPFNVNPNRANYYFGNIDSQRIAFSRGFVNFSPMDPRGRTVAHSRSYSLYNIQEEVVGGIESYSSLWGDVAITGIYAQ